MPELPEVETVKNALEPVMVGQVFKQLIFNRPDLRFPLPKTLPKKLKGQAIQAVSRRGKYITVFAKNGHGFVLHLGMSGVIRIEHTRDEQQSQKHDHVEFILENNVRIVFNDPRRFGFLDSLEEKNWMHYSAFESMGPEPLGNDFNGPVLFSVLQNRNTPIKSALLDQKIIAGLGNIYVCEALYRAGINPSRIAATITSDEAARLVEAIGGVLRKAIQAGGSSLKDYRHTDGQLGYFQHQLAVYDREGQACADCDCDRMLTGGVQRIVQAGRSTFYCRERQA